ncbi:MEDS domain-containing protein [Methanosarcina sp. T3]|uniref:MEDS domain-containing protein n=1 Tax=Methanosarcina sp. T3 TaxID=3439062 RepID=UPI003F8694FF
MKNDIRDSGIDIIGDMPWGTHFCQFYQTKEDLIDISIPFLKAGLENNELCLWLISEPLDMEEAEEALRRTIPDFDVYLERGQIELTACTDWHIRDGTFNLERALNSLIERVNRALTRGYNGLRIIENTCRLKKESRNDFINYERRKDSITGKYPILALCTCFLDICSATDIMEIVANHQFTLARKEGKWERIENSGRKNITESGRTEQEFRENEECYRMLFTNMTEGFGLVEVIYNGDNKPHDYRYLEVNPAFELYLGAKKERMLGKTMLETFPNVHPKAVEKYSEAALSGRPIHFEIFSRVANKYLDIYVFSPEKGKLALILRDITERKETETKLKETLDNLGNLVKERTAKLEKAYGSLKESERSLAEAQKMAHVGHWQWTIKTDESYWSQELYRIFGRNFQESSPTYQEFLSYVHPDDLDYVNNAAKKAMNGEPYSIDYRIVLANGEERTVHMQSQVIFDEQNIPVRIQGIVQDITERKKAEEALQKIEKIRIKEIHHRIKNNLQVISSLLDLQAETFSKNKVCKTPEVVEAFMESQSRVISMALIHEELYKGDKIDSLDFAAYLRKLTADLFRSHKPENKDISLELDLEQVFLGMDTAIPLGIIVNELVSNSFKHAFPHGKESKIQMKLQRNGTSAARKDISCQNRTYIEKKGFHYTLEVSDNGKGIPEEIDIENSNSLGLQLVNILVEQIDGCIKLERGQETKFTILFNDVGV